MNTKVKIKVSPIFKIFFYILIPIVAESLGGWHPVAVDQIKKLARCLATHTGQAIEASTAHLFTRLSTVLVRGCVEMVLNRSPTFPSPEIGGTE